MDPVIRSELEPHKVLDLGAVKLLTSMGSDLSVVGAARVSHAVAPEHASKGEEADAKLIRYLMTHRHGSPFEHAVFKWFIKAPIFVVREWQRHRIASYNEQSGRYATFEPQFYVPDHVRAQSPTNLQSSTLVAHGGAEVSAMLEDIKNHAARSFQLYQRLMHRGMAREMARMVLPVNLYTQFHFTVNARSLMNFLSLRNADDAQWEIRQYAMALESDFSQLMPMTYDAFIANGRMAP